MTRHASDHVATVLYADIFDYPLTDEEGDRWMIAGDAFRTARHGLGMERHKAGNRTYVVAPGRKHIIAIRQARMKIAEAKWRAVRRMITMFARIPTICLVGVTGGLAVENADAEDDIDIFIITDKRTLWITRCMVTIATDVMGIRRRPNESSVANKVCLNMFMARGALALPYSDRDLFSAHEVLQMVPVWDRDGTYREFLLSNRWVEHFLPNAWKEKVTNKRKGATSKDNQFALSAVCFLLSLFEPLAKILQLWYMRRHKTTEVIRPGMLRFHPRDARDWVKKRYALRLMRYNIPLDNIFYRR